MGLKVVSVANEVPGYSHLQQQMHDALRAQHPEWLQPDGDSPTCDCYDARFAELLRGFARTPWNKKSLNIRNFCGATSIWPLDDETAQREIRSLNKFYLRESLLTVNE